MFINEFIVEPILINIKIFTPSIPNIKPILSYIILTVEKNEKFSNLFLNNKCPFNIWVKWNQYYGKYVSN